MVYNHNTHFVLMIRVSRYFIRILFDFHEQNSKTGSSGRTIGNKTHTHKSYENRECYRHRQWPSTWNLMKGRVGQILIYLFSWKKKIPNARDIDAFTHVRVDALYYFLSLFSWEMWESSAFERCRRKRRFFFLYIHRKRWVRLVAFPRV